VTFTLSVSGCKVQAGGPALSVQYLIDLIVYFAI
jgi:hypothetical protein